MSEETPIVTLDLEEWEAATRENPKPPARLPEPIVSAAFRIRSHFNNAPTHSDLLRSRRLIPWLAKKFGTHPDASKICERLRGDYAAAVYRLENPPPPAPVGFYYRESRPGERRDRD